jgi:hypothetical protein
MKTLTAIFLMCAILRTGPTKPDPPFYPAPTGCVLVARIDVWLNVYQEQNGNIGTPILKELHLEQGGTQRVAQVPNDKIVYAYKTRVDDPYAGEIHASCQDGERVFVPQP